MVVPNEKMELLSMRVITGWRVRMDDQNINSCTKRIIHSLYGSNA